MKPIKTVKRTDIYNYFCGLILKNCNWIKFLENYYTTERYHTIICARTLRMKLNKAGVRLSYGELCNLLIFWEELGLLRLTNLDFEYRKQDNKEIKLVPLDDWLRIEFKVYFPDLAHNILDYYKNNYDS